MYKFLLVILFYFPLVFGQNEIHTFDLFTTQINNDLLLVRNLDSTIIYQKKFNDPTDLAADLDGDGVNEYLVTDAVEENGSSYFTVFIYNTIDTFYLADSIFSGLIEPYLSESEDVNGTVVVTGNPNFDTLNHDTTQIFIPVNCWKYSDGGVSLVNNRVYDVFISENDDIVDFVDKYYKSNPKSCSSTKNILAAIASVYSNYMNASENAIAAQFMDNYYFCSNVDQFKTKVINLMKESQ